MPLLLKRPLMVLKAEGEKNLEGRKLTSPTSYASQVCVGHTVTFQAGVDENNKAEQLNFLVKTLALYECASEMIAAVQLSRLVPGATKQEALQLYWRIDTTRWLPIEVGSTVDRLNLVEARSFCRLKNHHWQNMEACLRTMGVRPKTYKAHDMLQTLRQISDAGTKVGMRKDTVALRSPPDILAWDRWVKANPKMKYVVWGGVVTGFHIAGMTFPHIRPDEVCVRLVGSAEHRLPLHIILVEC
jgi:hypothetical protein